MGKKVCILLVFVTVICLGSTACRRNDSSSFQTGSTGTIDETTYKYNGNNQDGGSKEEGLGEEEIPVKFDENIDVTESSKQENEQEEIKTEESWEIDNSNETETDEENTGESGGLWSIGEEEI